MSTESGNQIIFESFRLDPENRQLWRGERAVALQPKPLAVLQYLAKRPGQVVSSKELLKTVWAGTVVTKAVVKECLRAIRAALGEDAVAPHYIETVGREGYRFLSPHPTTTPLVSGSTFHVSRSDGTSEKPETKNEKPETLLVGRESELMQLHKWFEKARQGQRQLVFVTGEPGIGKTTVVDLFQAWLQGKSQGVRMGRGQCGEQYTAKEKRTCRY